MNLLKILLLGLFGAVSAGIVHLTGILQGDLISFLPGSIFGFILLIGLTLIYKNKTKLLNAILFLIISTLAYFISGSLVMALTPLFPSESMIMPVYMIFFIASLTGTFIILLGLQLILKNKLKLPQIIFLSLIGGIIGLGYGSLINIETILDYETNKNFIDLFYFWNTIMALGIGVVLNKNQNKWQSNSQATVPRVK